MEDKQYVVTLHKKEDLEQFYNEMKLSNFPLVMKRPTSRNTHYMMTEDQAERLRQDPRVWGVDAVDDFHIKPQAINNNPYTVSGQFSKSGSSAGYRQWGHLHCAGDQTQRRKGSWGSGTVGDTVEIFNDGRGVDVVIVDDPMSWDSEEWYSPTTGQTRFVQYQWFNELNSIVNSIDDDFQTEPTGTITYHDGVSNPDYHGQHVAGTVAGQWYGWAPEATIYNLAVTGQWQSGQSVGGLLIFDYLRAFHKNKPVDLITGERRPTITNHSYGGIYYTPGENLQLSDINWIQWQGVQYDASNPGPSGWTTAGVEADFGVRFGVDTIPAWSSAIAADVQDAIEDGVVIIGAAGNDNLLTDVPGGPNWDNTYSITGVGTRYMNRGAWPNSPDTGAINVGALNTTSNFTRASFTQFGPGITTFAPGVFILSSFNSQGFADTKYTQGSGNYYYGIQGTSMASPQVCGVLACLATGKRRFTTADGHGLLKKLCITGDMTFNTGGGALDDNTCQQGSPNSYLHIENPRPESGYMQDLKGDRTSGMTYPRRNVFFQEPFAANQQTFTFTVNMPSTATQPYYFTGTDRQNGFSGSANPTLNLNVGDILELNLSVAGHPFWIKTSPTTGTSNGVGGVSGQGFVSGTMTWNTIGIPPGVYYYICQYHSNMRGNIILS